MAGFSSYYPHPYLRAGGLAPPPPHAPPDDELIRRFAMLPEKKAGDADRFDPVKAELEDLTNRLSKMVLFIGSDEAREIDREELDLLHSQADQMFRLQRILAMRIVLHESKSKAGTGSLGIDGGLSGLSRNHDVMITQA